MGEGLGRTPGAAVLWLQVGVRPRHTVWLSALGPHPAAPQTALTASPTERQVPAQKGLLHASPAGRRLGDVEKEPKDELMKERQANPGMTRFSKLCSKRWGWSLAWTRMVSAALCLFRLRVHRPSASDVWPTAPVLTEAHCSPSPGWSPLRWPLALTPPPHFPALRGPNAPHPSCPNLPRPRTNSHANDSLFSVGNAV